MSENTRLQGAELEHFIRFLHHLKDEKEYTVISIAKKAGITPQALHNHLKEDKKLRPKKLSGTTAASIKKAFSEEANKFFPNSDQNRRENLQKIIEENRLYAKIVIEYMHRKDETDLKEIEKIDLRIKKLNEEIRNI